MENKSRNKYIAVSVGLILVSGVFILGPVGLFPINELFDQEAVSESPRDTPSAVTSEGIIVQDVTIGTGREAGQGDRVAVHYVGQFENGTVFDSSIENSTPFIFTLGTGEVIAGWERGIEGMKPGGRRTLTIPPELAYGIEGRGPIPPNATLIFDVTLVAIEERED